LKVLTVLGARPQFIKAATVSRYIRDHSQIKEVIVHTGQHFDENMSEIFFDEMDIPKPHYMLGINSLTHGAMTGRILEKIEAVIQNESPDVVLVYGDTNSTLAGAIAASKLKVKIAHIEAGLRSFNMTMPEEINRILTDRISNFLFCPTTTAVNNLEKEGFNNFDCRIEMSGDVMYDSVLYYLDQLNGRNPGNDYALLTLHRQENIDDPRRLISIVTALNHLSSQFHIVFPIHPRTEKKLQELNIRLNFNPVAPVGYLEMIKLTRDSAIVLTDSGGLQKEAYFLNKPCITLRDETEWTELVDAGGNVLAGADEEIIIESCMKLFGSYIKPVGSLYGDGKAAEKICQLLMALIG